MQWIRWIFDLVVYYRKDEAAGKPYWQDPAFVALVVSILATELLKYAGINITADLQLKIVGTITGIAALVSPHTGVIAKQPAAPAKTGNPDDPHGLNLVS